MRLDSSQPWSYLGQDLPAPDLRRAIAIVELCQRSSPGHGFSFRDWAKEVALTSEAADRVLRPMLASFGRGRDPYWCDLIFYIFWPDLRQLAGRLRRLDRDQSRLDSRVCWAFLQALHRIDIEQRTSRLGLKLLNDTQHDVRRAYASDARRERRECLIVEEDDDQDVAGVAPPGQWDAQYAAIEMHHDRSWAVAQLRARVRAGQLARADFLILVGCHLYGRGLEEMAARLGLNYEAAKKRRQRAINHLNKFSPGLSPDCPESPLMSLSRTSRKERPRGREL